jgi:hypothetical protein
MPRKYLIALISVFCLAAFYLYFRWSSAIRQPLGFSHPVHVKAQIPCASCHTERSSEKMPPSSLCASCHKGMTIPSATRWIRVYRIAPDIIFDHRNHSKFSCSGCHEEMSSTRGWIHETRFPMDFCMDCHASEGAENDCKTCHKNR